MSAEKQGTPGPGSAPLLCIGPRTVRSCWPGVAFAHRPACGRARLARSGCAMAERLQHKVLLSEDEMPTRWYNVLHDLPTPPPPVLHPGTGQPVGPDDLAPLFPM